MRLQKLIVGIILLALASILPVTSSQAQSVRPPENAVNQPIEEMHGISNTLGADSQSDYWRDLHDGVKGKVSIPDQNAGVMVQSEGWRWMLFRNGPLQSTSAWAFGILFLVIVLFFLFRGRIRVDSGYSGVQILRFGRFARYGHWLNAIAFLALAITGLNMLFGRAILLPLVGPQIFASITSFGKFVHNWGSYFFILGTVWIFVAFVAKNFPSRDDVGWVMKGGGMFKKGLHPPSRFFNFGEKIIFWAAIFGGISIIATGLALLFPFQLNFFPGEFAVHKMQFASMWHGIVGIALILVVIGHIYIGTIGIEGAFGSMTSGYVDRNWAREHHSLWLEEVDAANQSGDVSNEPAE